jgi:hypothetical protein
MMLLLLLLLGGRASTGAVRNQLYGATRKRIYEDRLPKYRKLFEDADLLGSAIELVKRMCDVYRQEVPTRRDVA